MPFNGILESKTHLDTLRFGMQAPKSLLLVPLNRGVKFAALSRCHNYIANAPKPEGTWEMSLCWALLVLFGFRSKRNREPPFQTILWLWTSRPDHPWKWPTKSRFPEPASIRDRKRWRNWCVIGFIKNSPGQWKLIRGSAFVGARQRSGEGVVRRNGCPKGCFWRVRFFSAP